MSTGSVAANTMPTTTAIVVDIVRANIVARRITEGRLYCALRHNAVTIVLSPSSVTNIIPVEARKVSIGITSPSSLLFVIAKVVREARFELANSYESGYPICMIIFHTILSPPPLTGLGDSRFTRSGDL